MENIVEYFSYSKESTYAIARDSLPAEFVEGEAVPIESRIRLGYGDTAQEYLNSGRRDVNTMIRVLEQCGFTLLSTVKVLDFGCGGGRMLRHIPSHFPEGTYWGCDTESRAVAWAQVYLGNKFHLFTNLREPHLPFEDGYFDFIYAGSVFSHIHDLAEFWMLELRRVTKKDGLLYLTFQDDVSVGVIREQAAPSASHYFQKVFLENNTKSLFAKDYRKIVVGRDSYSSQVFYKTDWLKTLLQQFFSRVNLVPHAYGWQTAAVLQK